MTATPRVAIAMSGGVDSSVAAVKLAEQGMAAFGVMLRLWAPAEGPPNRCCSPADMSAARRIAAALDLPFYALDVQGLFRRQVVDFFTEGYSAGLTPNPCLECNRKIRWEYLLEHALALGATHLATGHYARVEWDGGQYQLLRAVDRSKDQTYVLSVLNQRQLARAKFPLGGLTKTEVRELARQRQLEVADRRESQDLCFLGGGDYRGFLVRMGTRQTPPGQIVDQAGTVLGEHQGLAAYTLGQRKGLGVASSHPVYVLDKDLARNQLVVGPSSGRARRQFLAGPVHWVSERSPAGHLRVMVCVRYRSQEAPATLWPLEGGKLRVELDVGLMDVTPGQAAVFYDGDVCLGMAPILP